jgi:ElaB/YqjD/DUF883 family membrane-anchored ribosome-binding protein
MNSNPSSGQTSRSAAALAHKPPGVAASPTSGHVDSEHVEGLDDDMNKLRREMASLKDNVARLASQLGDEAVKAARNVSQAVSSQVGGAASGVVGVGSELASSAKQHAKTFASELEGMARRNPLGTIAGALVVGIVIGMMSRGRS